MSDIITIGSYNMSWASDSGMIFGSEGSFLTTKACQESNGRKCWENAFDLGAGVSENFDRS